MDFVNETPFAASIARTELLWRDLLLATVVLKSTYDVDPRTGALRPSEEQPPVAEADVDTGLGPLDMDLVPVKSQCDLAVYGYAQTESPDRAVESMRVTLAIGEFRRTVAIFGDRFWTKRGSAFEPSRPAPFSRMPIVWERAYGGSAFHTDDLEAPYPSNPDGRGFVAMASRVEGTPLPNIEEVDQLLTSWDQRPLPAALTGVRRTSALRGTRGIHADLERQMTRLDASAFTFAHPRMQLGSYPAGARVELEGMTPGRRWGFVLPPPRAHAVLGLGNARYELPFEPDTIVLFPEQSRFHVVSRRALVYQFAPERLRSLHVVLGAGKGSSGRVTSIAELKRAPRPAVALRPAMDDDAMLIPFETLLEAYPLTRILEQLPLCPSGA